MAITCKNCGSENYVKNGKVRKKQRYKCKACGNNFIVGDELEKVSPEGKALAALLCGSGKSSYGFIANLFNVTRPAVQKWIRKIASRLPEPKPDDDIQEVQIDEMWHFIDQKNKKYGYGGPWTVLQTKPSHGLLAIVLLKPLRNSTRKS
jgi:transposase-like protein